MLFLFLGKRAEGNGKGASYFFAARRTTNRANNKLLNQTNTEYKNG